MNIQHKQSTKGFTIIEVVLVLAIAGLIFLMVVVAFPSVERGQRDEQRKRDMSRIEYQMSQYISTTRGKAPSSPENLGKFVRGYLKGTDNQTAGDEYMDPSGDGYKLRYAVPPEEIGQIGYYGKSTCDPDSADGSGVSQSGASREFALTVKLESQNALYCIDSSS